MQHSLRADEIKLWLSSARRLYATVLPKRFRLNGNTIGFHSQTQKLELHTK